MSTYKNIVVGINYTESSEHALWQAKHLADQSGGKVLAIHIVPTISWENFPTPHSLSLEDLMQSAQTSLEAFVHQTLGSNHAVKCHISEGVRHHEIVLFAENKQADLLVLGSDNSSDDPHKSGHFALRCLRFATIPVLLVRGQADKSFNHVVACIDFSNSTTPILENTVKIIADDDAAVELLHASRPPWMRPRRLQYETRILQNDRLKTEFKNLLDQQIQTALQASSHLMSSAPFIVVLEKPNVNRALLSHLKTTKANLAIIGRSGKGVKGLKTDLIGGTAEILLRYSECSILIVPII